MAMAIGTKARLVQPVIKGEILDIRYNKDAAGLEMLVNYQDGEGESHARWFLESQLEEVV